MGRAIFRLLFFSLLIIVAFALITPRLPEDWVLRELGEQFLDGLGAFFGYPV